MFENFTFEEWNTTLIEKYKELHKIVNDLIPELWIPLEFALSIQKILNIKGCSLPFAGILLGAPSSMKSRIIELFRGSKNSYYTDKFSAKSFVSHISGINEEQLQKIDMLPKIKNKYFLTSDLSPMFTKKQEEISEIIGIITRVLDGEGFMADSGACGQRGYSGEHMFTWLGASVDIPFRVHKLMGIVGSKLHFLRLSKNNKGENELLASMDKDDFVPKLRTIRRALIEYLQWFDRCPVEEGIAKVTREGDLIKIQWDNDRDEEYTKRIIVRLGLLLGRLRAVVTTWKDDIAGTEYGHSTAIIEDPLRAITQLRNLARGHALMQGRTWITIQDLPLLIKVVLSTASLDRVNIFDLLIAHNGVLSTSIIKASLNTDHHVAHRIMEELNAVELVDYEERGNSTEEKEIKLKDREELQWFLSDEFKELRQGFEPTDYSEFLKEYCKKYNICLDQNLPPQEEQGKPIQYAYTCYECVKVNHGTPTYQTNSKSDYERHWISSGHKGSCYPAIPDLEYHNWIAQGKDWEK